MIPFKKFLLEGGAAGHMAHPFDLQTVNRGTDLISFFKKAFNSLKRSKGKKGFVKFDGVNVSVKLIQDDEGNFRFALDRGSNKELDIQGITADNIDQRFDASTAGGQSLINIGKFLLPIMDSAIQLILPELKKLKMTVNINRFLNTEYITGQTNVTQYDRNMVVFHGVNEFFLSKSLKRGSVSRASKEVNYNVDALNELVNKLRPVFNQHGFEVFGPTAVNLTQQVNFESILNEPFKVVYSANNIVTQPLSAWLRKAVNPRSAKITDINGKLNSAMNKNNYLHILNGNPLDLITTDKKNQKLIVDGAVLYHATRLLGNAVLQSLSSSAGELTKHEGIVLRDPTISSVPVKITGEFIVTGMESPFKK